MECADGNESDGRRAAGPGWRPWAAVGAGLAGVVAVTMRTVFVDAPALEDTDSPSLAVALSAVFLSPSVGLYLAWLALLAIVGFLARGESRVRANSSSHRDSAPSPIARLAVACLVASFAFGTAARFGWDARELPPAYQDEYSYLFQAKTFLAGRIVADQPPAAEHFDQMHVLNVDGVFASRYFPGTALWYAPFVALGIPYVGGWLLHSLTAGFVALAASRFSLVAGVVAGMLVAASTGMVLFANTVLSPSPTMLGMAIGWWGFQETFVTKRSAPALFAGAAIGFAFLARPLTAAALGWPWALLAVLNLCSRDTRLRRPLTVMILTFLPSVVLLGGINFGVTGSIWQTPHGKWTALHSPSHVYGFYNRTRAEAKPSTKTIMGYDSWAEELTFERSLRITASRWERGAWLMAGFVPTVSLGLLAILLCGRLGNVILLPIASVVTLTLAYLPFGFEGIFGCSYIIEATPFVLLAGSIALASVFRDWWTSGRRALGVVWLGLPVISVILSLASDLPEAFAPSSEFIHPRLVAERRNRIENLLAPKRHVLIVYDARIGDDRHGAWVYNDPFLRDRVLRAWKLDDMASLLQAYPERFVFESRILPDGTTDIRAVRPPVGRVEESGVD